MTIYRITDDTRVMSHDAAGRGDDIGTVANVFCNWTDLEIGIPQGADAERGAYDWWPVTIDGEVVAELRDDANGLTLHVTPEHPGLEYTLSNAAGHFWTVRGADTRAEALEMLCEREGIDASGDVADWHIYARPAA
jgi:hypothetical protein